MHRGVQRNDVGGGECSPQQRQIYWASYEQWPVRQCVLLHSQDVNACRFLIRPSAWHMPQRWADGVCAEWQHKEQGRHFFLLYLGEQMHRSEGINWKKSGTHENADRFVGYPPARYSLCKFAASPGSAVVMSLKAFISSLKFPLAAVV